MALRAPLPTGTVTLLFTDIEGSTRHWEQQRAEMPAALRRHDELIRTAVEAHGGHVFKTVGDAFCVAFSRASEAISAAADAQRTLAAEDWSAVGGLHVRMALHSGATDERDGDYFGTTVNRAARLLAVAHGGQIVVSGATAQLLRGVMPERAELSDLGEHELKDLVEPERVWQLIAPGLRESFPTLRSLQSLPNNLPRRVGPLIGRDDVLAEIEPLVLEHPLVTLVGTGGVGKTRLALQAGANLLDDSDDGVWFVELAPLSDAASLANAIATTFGLREQGERPMADVLVQYLRSRRLLLIVDNCEHLIEGVARLADAILHASSHVRILATSREPLRIAAERVYRVPSLGIPSDETLTIDQALQYGSIALFAERAKASDARFVLTDESAPIVAEICRRLDGIALAIELAAARVKVLPPRQLAQRLDERFRVLTGGSRTALPRQQTMRALIDWSHELLSPQERLVFCRVSIFVGGWTLEAAESVCADQKVDALDVVDSLSSLVEKSLVVADVQRDVTRYRLLESTRAFALEKLEQSGEREILALRHAQWMGELADRAYEARWAQPTSQWSPEFAPEVENARSAIGWILGTDETVLAARIVTGFSVIYRTLLGEAEIRSWLRPILDRLDADAQPALAARAWHALSSVSIGSRTIETAKRALELGERCGDPVVIALSLSSVAFGLTQVGQPEEAQPVIDRAVQVSKEAGLMRSSIYANALNLAGTIARASHRFDEARQLQAEALSLATTAGYESLVTAVRMNMAELEFNVGNPARSLELVTAIVAETQGRFRNRTVIGALCNEAAYRIVLGDMAGAHVAARDALRLARGAFAQAAMIAIGHLAALAAHGDQPHCGGRLRGYVNAWYDRVGYEREPTEQSTYDILMVALRERLGDAEIKALAAEGAQLSEDQAVAEALAV